MAISDDIGLLNNAGLAGGEVVAIIEHSSQILDHAQNKIINILQDVRAVKGDLNSPTLLNYLTSLQDALDRLRSSQNSNMEAIVAINKGGELGQEYVGKLHL